MRNLFKVLELISSDAIARNKSNKFWGKKWRLGGGGLEENKIRERVKREKF